MKSENIVQQKSYVFAVKIIDCYKLISQEHHEYVLSKQLLKCGTSIGANIEEAIGGQSKADFIAKISIAYKEARECLYWIRLLKETDYLNSDLALDLIKDVEELLRIIGKIQVSLKQPTK